MKTLFLGINIDNDNVEQHKSVEKAPSLFDYDLVIIDPDIVLGKYILNTRENSFITSKGGEHTYIREINGKLKKEAKIFLKNGGIIVCLIKPLRGYKNIFRSGKKTTTSYYHNYDWLPITVKRFHKISEIFEHGSGKRIKPSSRVHSFHQYLKMDSTFWNVYFEKLEVVIDDYSCLACNDVSLCVSLEFNINDGRLILIPPSSHDNFPNIILDCAVKYRNSLKGIKKPAPLWLSKYIVPEEKEISQVIISKKEELEKLELEISELNNKYDLITNVKKILYEQSDELEVHVKDVFNEFGFNLEKKGDIDLISNSEEGLLLEITGSESAIDITKFRQLLQYLLTDIEKTGDEKKAILVGNHYMNIAVDKRGIPFTKKAIDESKVHKICLLSTTELYNITNDYRLKKISKNDIWNLMKNTTGVLKYK